MKKRVLSILLALVLTLSLAPAAMAASDNVNAQNYGRWAGTVRSYLLENAQGGVTRVEYIVDYTGESIIVEDYDPSFNLTGSRTIPMELPYWGGFFAGEDYNFFLFGQRNREQNNSAEVIRVVKYSKDWQRLGAASLRGANTTDPFVAGSLRCAETGGYLYIRTCHEMYASRDGINHQASMTLCVRQSDMSITDSNYGVSNIGTGYVSHSFNQFILVDSQNRIVTVDHGDAYPRSVVLTRCSSSAGQGRYSGSFRNIDIQKLPGAIGDNITGCSVGGLEETSDGYVVAYNYNGTGGSESTRDIHLAFVNKNLSGLSVTCLTANVATRTPQLVSTGPDGGYILWTDYDTEELSYAAYDANGKVGTVKTASAALSDCKPIVHDGNVVWYVTSYYEPEPVFYLLNDAGVQRVTGDYVPEPTDNKDGNNNDQSKFKDLAENAYYLDAVAWAVDQGIVAGLTDTEFGPEVTCTQAQILTFLWRAAGQPVPESTASLTAAETGKYYSDAVAWARQQGMLDDSFSAEAPCTRAMTVTWLWKQSGAPASGAAAFADVPANAGFAPAVAWATANGITSGTGNTTFSPDKACTRAQVVTFLYRAKTL